METPRLGPGPVDHVDTTAHLAQVPFGERGEDEGRHFAAYGSRARPRQTIPRDAASDSGSQGSCYSAARPVSPLEGDRGAVEQEARRRRAAGRGGGAPGGRRAAVRCPP